MVRVFVLCVSADAARVDAVPSAECVGEGVGGAQVCDRPPAVLAADDCGDHLGVVCGRLCTCGAPKVGRRGVSGGDDGGVWPVCV